MHDKFAVGSFLVVTAKGLSNHCFGNGFNCGRGELKIFFHSCGIALIIP